VTALVISAGSEIVGGRPAAERGQLGGISPGLWVALLDDAASRARVHEKVYRRGPGQCHYWLGALTSSGHGRVRLRVRAASAPRPASVVVAADVYLYQESRGLLRPLPDGACPPVRHRCGEPSCLNPIHLAAGTAGANPAGAIGAGSMTGQAADIRGAQGRAMAIRDAIVGAIEAAAAAGIPARQMALPFPGRTGLLPGHCRGDTGVAAAAASAVVIPVGQGELF
jgi:hypothetical protein